MCFSFFVYLLLRVITMRMHHPKIHTTMLKIFYRMFSTIHERCTFLTTGYLSYSEFLSIWYCCSSSVWFHFTETGIFFVASFPFFFLFVCLFVCLKLFFFPISRLLFFKMRKAFSLCLGFYCKHKQIILYTMLHCKCLFFESFSCTFFLVWHSFT